MMAKVRVLSTLVIGLVLLLTNGSYADDAQGAPVGSFEYGGQMITVSAPVYAQLQKLTTASFKEKSTLIVELADMADKPLPLLSLILDSELYYDKTNKQYLYRLSDTDDQQVLIAPLSASIPVVSTSDNLKKVRTNNRLRKAIKAQMAQVSLFKGSVDERLSAVQSMMDRMDADSVLLIQQARALEKNDDIQELMAVALAIYNLEAGTRVEKINAAQLLSGRLEPTARYSLRQAAQSTTDDVELKNIFSKAYSDSEGKVEFYGFLETLFFGLSLGSVFLLAAIGLAITFGVMGVINMAHGEMIMLGAYTTYVVQLLLPNHLEYSIVVAIPAAFLVAGAMGVLIERCVIRFLHGRPLETLLATFGLSLILQQLVRTVFSPLNRQVSSPEWMSGAWQLNPVLSLTYNRLYILAFSLLVFVVLVYVFKKTNLGLNVRAVSQNRDMAKAMGVKTHRVDALTFGLGSGVAGVAGVALSQLTNVGPNLGQSYIIDSFMVVVFGGVGNLVGTLVGAFSLGLANKFLEPVTGAVLANIVVLVFIILFIQKRPKGLFPQKGRAAE